MPPAPVAQSRKRAHSRPMMRAVEIRADHTAAIIETAVPALGTGEVLVKPCACGICGTDLHILRHGSPGTRYPVIPGHEFAGHVVAVASGVKGVREGDFVAVDPNVVCGSCRWCRIGRPNLCVALTPIGVGRSGAAAEYVAVPMTNAFTVSEALGGDLAALIEPLACALHAVDTAQGIRDRSVLIFGGGTMGLLIALVARLKGAGDITIVDPAAGKRQIAQACGFDRAITSEGLGSERFDAVFEAAGVRAALEQAVDRVEKTGILVQVGVHDEEATVPFNPFRIYEREIRIIGSNSCADKFPEAVDVMSDIADNARHLIGPSYAVWDFDAAIRGMAAGTAVKTQLRF
jgi:2-desacetyl-2-hydroxyethyl bacteriochlorophyllide A dehydrogenase